VTAAAAVAGVAAAGDRRALVPLALLAVLVPVVSVLPARPGPSSRWWRGWGLVTFAVVPAAASLAVPGPGATGPALLLVAGGLVLCGFIGSLPAREPARARELVLEAALGGGLTAYLFGAFVPGTTAIEISAMAVAVSAWWLMALLLLREREQATRAGRWLAAAFALVLAAHLLDDVLLATGPGATVAMLLAGAGIVAWAVACSQPELREHVPPALPAGDTLQAGHVRIVVVGVLAGPVAVASSWLLDPAIDLLPLVLAGGALALVAVLHLLQLVRDHGRRAWRARHDALTGLPSETTVRGPDRTGDGPGAADRDRVHRGVPRPRRLQARQRPRRPPRRRPCCCRSSPNGCAPSSGRRTRSRAAPGTSS
jgi:hypothetical protein